MRRIATALGAAVIAVAPLLTRMPAAAATCPAPPPMTFGRPSYVDTARAGGEPMIAVHPDGTLLYGAHAGTTHFYGGAAADTNSAAFVQNYIGQTYLWYSNDDGQTWTYAPRPLPDNAPLSGFSDPDFAIDAAGQVYLSEINLVNVAMSKSTDTGRSYELQNFFAQFMHDRQWSEADEKDVVYLTGNSFGGGTVPTDPAGHIWHTLYKSKDGGRTFGAGVPDGSLGGDSGLGDLRIDRRDGTLYEAHYDSTTDVLSIVAFRKARQDDLTPSQHTVARGVDLRSHWPSFDIDAAGNLAMVWDESGDGARAAGVWYAYSADRGVTWSKPVRVDRDGKTDIWPWIAAGDAGRFAVAWFEATAALPDHDAEASGDHGWHVMAAQTLSGTGCEDSATPGFTVVRATDEPFHRGTICMGGTICQVQGVDRRLGDYFSIDVDAKGRIVAAYSDTREGGAVSLPAFLRQSGGPSFIGTSVTVPPPGTKKPATRPRVLSGRKGLPATGVADPWIAGIALLVAAVAVRRLAARPR